MGEQQKNIGTTTSGVLGSAVTGDQRAESVELMRRALQATSAILQAIAKQEKIDERSGFTIRSAVDGVTTRCTIAEALDMANEALEPEGRRARGRTQALALR